MSIIEKKRSNLALVSLILANLIPLAGVIFYEWDVFTIMFLFWAESAVVGFYTILKFLKSGGLGGLFISGFFSVHFGIFMFVHLTFIISLFGADYISNSSGLLSLNEAYVLLGIVALPLVAMFISHGISFFKNFLEESKDNNFSAVKLMLGPYKRIGVMHITIIIGGFIIAFFEDPFYGIILLVVLKIAADVGSHIREHSPAIDKDVLLNNKEIRRRSIIKAFLAYGPVGLVKAIKEKQAEEERIKSSDTKEPNHYEQ